MPAVFVAVPFAITQQHPAHRTHRYELSDPALAAAAQRYDWAQEGKGDRAELENLVALVCDPGSYTNPYTVEAPFVRDLGSTVILGGWVRLSGTNNGRPFEQKARFADIWHKGQKGWQLTFTQVTLAEHP